MAEGDTFKIGDRVLLPVVAGMNIASATELMRKGRVVAVLGETLWLVRVEPTDFEGKFNDRELHHIDPITRLGNIIRG